MTPGNKHISYIYLCHDFIKVNVLNLACYLCQICLISPTLFHCYLSQLGTLGKENWFYFEVTVFSLNCRMKLLVLEFWWILYILSCIWKWSKFFTNLENTLEENNFTMVILWELLFVCVDFLLVSFFRKSKLFLSRLQKGFVRRIFSVSTDLFGEDRQVFRNTDFT